MRMINPAHVAAISKTVNACPYFDLLSMEMKSLGRGESHLEVTLDRKHLQPYGLVHGGVCASLIDACVYWAVYADIEEIVGLTTVEMKLNYLAPVSEGILIGRGRSIKAGKKICLGEAAIVDRRERLVAHGTSTLMILDALEIEGQEDLPPKFAD